MADDKKQRKFRLPPTSGWTREELQALDELTKKYGTDRSKLLRQLVRSAGEIEANVIEKLEKAGK